MNEAVKVQKTLPPNPNRLSSFSRPDSESHWTRGKRCQVQLPGPSTWWSELRGKTMGGITLRLK